MTSSTLFHLILLMRVAHFLESLTSILTHGTFKAVVLTLFESLIHYTQSTPTLLNQDSFL